MSGDKKLILRSDRVDETRIGDRLVLYHRDTGAGIVLNPVGSLVWETLANPRSTDEIVHFLTQRYESIARERVSEDVAAYVGSLRGQSLIDEVR
jgi:hypothetical protein